WATADDAPYLPRSGETLPPLFERGADWFRLDVNDPRKRLVFFEVDLPERDNLPVDVAVHRLEGDQPAPYVEGMDPVSPPHEVQALPGNKFTTRLIGPG